MAENDHERNTVSECVDDRGEGVAASGPFGDHCDTYLTGAPGIPVGNIHGALLVAGQHQRHLAVLMKRVKDRQNIIPRQGRNEFASFGLENIHYGIGNSHYLFLVLSDF